MNTLTNEITNKKCKKKFKAEIILKKITVVQTISDILKNIGGCTSKNNMSVGEE